MSENNMKTGWLEVQLLCPGDMIVEWIRYTRSAWLIIFVDHFFAIDGSAKNKLVSVNIRCLKDDDCRINENTFTNYADCDGFEINWADVMVMIDSDHPHVDKLTENSNREQSWV